MSFQCMLEVAVVHVLLQIWWQDVPHTRTGSRKTSVAEAVVRACYDTYPLRRRSKLRTASVGSKLNVARYDGVCSANDGNQVYLYTCHTCLTRNLLYDFLFIIEEQISKIRSVHFWIIAIMVALWNRADHYIFILWFLLSSFFFLFFLA